MLRLLLTCLLLFLTPVFSHPASIRLIEEAELLDYPGSPPYHFSRRPTYPGDFQFGSSDGSYLSPPDGSFNPVDYPPAPYYNPIPSTSTSDPASSPITTLLTVADSDPLKSIHITIPDSELPSLSELHRLNSNPNITLPLTLEIPVSSSSSSLPSSSSSISEKTFHLPFNLTLPSFLSFLFPPASACPNTTIYTTLSDPDPSCRAKEIQKTRQGWQYGPSVLGESSAYPNGTLGTAESRRQQTVWWAEEVNFGKLIVGETAAAGAAVWWEDGLQGLDDYEAVYDGQWKSTVPGGVSDGALEGFRSDRTFAMQRLTGNAFSLRRMKKGEELPFSLDDDDVREIAGWTKAEGLRDAGRLFIVDHRFFNESVYRENLIEGRHAGASVALFFLDAENELMPLAIATGVRDEEDPDGDLLVYTKLDGEYEWLLAKIVFNSNDLWWGQIYHLIATHSIAEIAYLAAIRTLSERHPVRAYLDRVMYRSFAVRPIGSQVLFNRGGLFDSIFSISSRAVLHFVKSRYPTQYGSFSGGYLLPELESRGLILSNSSSYSDYRSSPPTIATFPFHSDMSRLHSLISSFTSTFLSSFYPNSSSVTSDPELQHWFREANGPAEVHSFPPTTSLSLSTLIEVLTHMAYLAGPKHASLNMGTIFTTSGVLPMNPAALYKELPKRKGMVDREEELIKFLPKKVEAVRQARILALFNRPEEYLRDRGWRMVDVWKGLGDRVANSRGVGADPGQGGMGEDERRGIVKEAVGKWERECGELADEIEARGRVPSGKEGSVEYGLLSPRRFPFFLAI